MLDEWSALVAGFVINLPGPSVDRGRVSVRDHQRVSAVAVHADFGDFYRVAFAAEVLRQAIQLVDDHVSVRG